MPARRRCARLGPCAGAASTTARMTASGTAGPRRACCVPCRPRRGRRPREREAAPTSIVSPLNSSERDHAATAGSPAKWPVTPTPFVWLRRCPGCMRRALASASSERCAVASLYSLPTAAWVAWAAFVAGAAISAAVAAVAGRWTIGATAPATVSRVAAQETNGDAYRRAGSCRRSWIKGRERQPGEQGFAALVPRWRAVSRGNSVMECVGKVGGRIRRTGRAALPETNSIR